MHHVTEQLRKAADTFEERAKAYGDSRVTGKELGDLIAVFTGKGQLNGEQSFLLSMILLKLHRWSSKPDSIQNEDNLRDLIVYAAMLHHATYADTELSNVGINDAAETSS